MAPINVLNLIADAVDPCGRITRVDLLYGAWMLRSLATKLELLAMRCPLEPGDADPLAALQRLLEELPARGELNYRQGPAGGP